MNQDLSTSLEMTVGSGRDDRMEALEVTRRKRGFFIRVRGFYRDPARNNERFHAIKCDVFLLFPGTREKKKSGWNLLFYALLINVAYGFVVMFTDYGSVGSFIGSLIGSAIGGYFLFQIRSSYSKSAPTRKAKKA